MHHGNGQLGHHIRGQGHVALVFGHVGHEDGLLLRRRGSDDPLSQLKLLGHDIAVITLEEGGPQRTIWIGEKDPQERIVDEPLQLPGDVRQQSLGVQDGIELADDG